MFGTLVRWAVRLFFFGLIAGVVGFVVTRLMGGEDDDFDDFEDLEASFEFNETPVEIDVSGPSTGEITSAGTDTAVNFTADATSEIESSPAMAAGDADPVTDSAPADDLSGGDNSADVTGSEARLIDIKGIGPGYEARLRSMGIVTFDDLLQADSEQLAENASIIGGAPTVDDWKEQARTLNQPQ